MSKFNFNQRIHKLKTSGNFKFKNIDYQLHYLLRKFESEKKHKGYFPKFKQGDIVFVDFGLNINHEFSNSHFAIVLNHNDSNQEDIINVVPLSSKHNSKYLKINIDMKLKYITNAIDTLNDKKKEYETLLNELNEFNPHVMSDEEIQLKFTEFIKWENSSSQKIAKIDKDVSRTKDAITKLKKLKNTTYVCVNSFQPISKFRIKNIYPKEISNVSVDAITLLAIINQINLDLLSLPKIE
ncbi:type II toxin-antitoxin system PemK/MazF family toxin [Staphylococcus chromogenes]|uniref:type II toxin-antitoxin system PemK/MazF family toxin n=1 Tax=Staphylococcus chromogenes TaxID=46126 RepID=UPI0028FF043D|nr:type II toxin-antitoxin system PemK/MazF family toxin [Staphylococcus chromogenes]MDU0476311.1 type II toxin-antitoxin system PemK/MazF family toxin [Staphylococcus chromogenes]